LIKYDVCLIPFFWAFYKMKCKFQEISRRLKWNVLDARV
jgi:hypothetical protein